MSVECNILIPFNAHRLEEYVSGRMSSHDNPGNATVPMATGNTFTNENGSFKHIKTINIVSKSGNANVSRDSHVTCRTAAQE